MSRSDQSSVHKLHEDIKKILSKVDETACLQSQVQRLESGQNAIRDLLVEVKGLLKEDPLARTSSVTGTKPALPAVVSDLSVTQEEASTNSRQISTEDQEARATAERAFERSSGYGLDRMDRMSQSGHPLGLTGPKSRQFRSFEEGVASRSRMEEGGSIEEVECTDSDCGTQQSHKTKVATGIELHSSWENSKIPVRRFVQLSFDVFASSRHTDANIHFGSTMLQAMSNTRKGHNLAKEFARLFGVNQQSQYVKSYKYMFLSPSSNITFFWTMLEMFVLITDFILVPMMMFDEWEGREKNHHPTMMGSKYGIFSWYQRRVSVAFWTVDFPMCFFKGYVDRKGDRETRLKKFALRYIKGNCILDLCLLCIDWTLLFLTAGNYMGPYESFIYMLRFARIMRLPKFRRLSRRLFARVKSAEALAAWSMGGHLFAIIMFCHISACFWYGIGQFGENHSNMREGWTIAIPPEKANHHAYCYFESLRWAFSVLGHGDTYIRPTNWVEGMYQSIFSILCIAVITHFLGNVVTCLIRLQEAKREVRQNKSDMREFLRQHRVSFYLQDRIWQVLKSVNTDNHKMSENKVALITELPGTLVVELRAEVFVPVLTMHPFFGIYGVSGADPHAMYNIIRKNAVDTKLLEAKQELFSEHEEARSMFFIVQGSIQYRFNHTVFNLPFDKNRESAEPPLHWIGEAALWLNWKHVGYAWATTPCDLVELHGESFRSIMQADLPQAQKYARAFRECAKILLKEGKKMNDMEPGMLSSYMLAQDVFAPAKAFEIHNSTPVSKGKLDEWQPPSLEDWHTNWTSPWSDSHSLSSSAVISTMTQEMKRDIVMVYQTLYSQNSPAHPLGGYYEWGLDPDRAAKELYDKRVLFLKRFLVALAMCRVSCTDEDNSSDTQKWPYPLASVLCHGGRTLLRLHGVQPREVLNFLLLGNKDAWNWQNGAPPPLYTRLAASHSVKVDCAAQLQEVRLRGVNGARGQGHNLGMDLPLGGLGNPTPKHAQGNLFVGPAGIPFKLNTRQEPWMVKDYQHGHLYIRWDEFGNKPMRQLVLQDRVGGDKDDPQTTLETRYVTELRRLCNIDDSSPLSSNFEFRQVDKVEELRELLAKKLKKQQSHQHSPDDHPHHSPGKEIGQEDMNRVEHLFSLTQERKELMFETDSKGFMRPLRGVLVHLALEFEAADGQVSVLVHVDASTATDRASDAITNSESSKRLYARRLTHTSHRLAPATCNMPQRVTSNGNLHASGDQLGTTAQLTSSRTPSLQNAQCVPDQRVITVICRYDGLWLPTLLQYLQTTFNLENGAIEKILQGIDEDEPVWLGPSAGPPTVCHHHAYAAGIADGDFLEVEYDALYLKSRIKAQDQGLFEKILYPLNHRFATEDVVPSCGFPDQPHDTHPPPGFTIQVKREWAWMLRETGSNTPTSNAPVTPATTLPPTPMAAPLEDLVKGLVPPPVDSHPLMLKEKKDLSLGSLLLGIENSAPLKEDLFGGTHTASAKSKDTSAFGRRKWRDFRKSGKLNGNAPSPAFLKVPAELGGIQMSMNKRQFDDIQKRCAELDLVAPSTNTQQGPTSSDESELNDLKRLKEKTKTEMELFRRILAVDAENAEKIMETFVLCGPEGLQRLDQKGRHVRGRILPTGTQTAGQFSSESPTAPSSSMSMAPRASGHSSIGASWMPSRQKRSPSYKFSEGIV